MRTTVILDYQLLNKAALTRCRERSPLLREALRALIERESSMRLARLGGTDPDASASPRPRPNARFLRTLRFGSITRAKATTISRVRSLKTR